MKAVKLNKSYTAIILCLCQFCAKAQGTEPFLDLDLQEVLELEITSVSKKPQTVSRAAAAAFVITSDDIRRSGAQNLPDALRLAPGLQVAQISSNAWAVTARGPNGRFANKLLVMIDGRTVYSPMFSGVSWSSQDMVLADIERIEVIRGPGAALWGANAVNGVINIITKSAATTQGTLLDASVGNASGGNVSMRYGGHMGDSGHWRLYAKALENRPLELANGLGKGMDGWRQQRLGARTDFTPTARDAVTLQGEIFRSVYGESSNLNRTEPSPGYTLQGIQSAEAGGHILGRWQRDLQNNNTLISQAYFDRSRLDWPAHAAVTMDILDLDTQYRHRSWSDHDVVLGASFRQSSDRVSDSTTGLPTGVRPYETFTVDHLRTRMWSVMAQDDISLIPEKLTLTLGSKLEKYDSENIKALPNARVMWTPKDNQTFWTSASKALRTPSRIDRNGTMSTLMPADQKFEGQPLPRPTFATLSGVTTPEELWAYEIGWKQRLAPGLTLDTTAYYNNYKKLRSNRYTMDDVRCMQSSSSTQRPFNECFLAPTSNHYFIVPAVLGNQLSGHSQGVEVWLDWQASRQHRLQASITRYSMSIQSNNPNIYSFESPNSSPKWTQSVHWSYTPSKQIETDVVVRHVSALPDVSFGQSVPAYTALDMRWAWSSSQAVQWSVTGRNLLMSRHIEFVSEALDVAATLIGPSVIFGVRVQY